MPVAIAKVPSDVAATPLHLQVYFQTLAREGHLLQRRRRSPRIVSLWTCLLAFS